ncbi:hypothetical protein KEM54_004145 [Ascosphaera aggregata]|nr:hypothetical protein KEM54_004145 [Ascosphaera aggregata]
MAATVLSALFKPAEGAVTVAGLRKARGKYFAAHRFYLSLAVLLLLVAWRSIPALSSAATSSQSLSLSSQSQSQSQLSSSLSSSSDSFLPSLRYIRGQNGGGLAKGLHPRGDDDGNQCRRVHKASDKCAWIRTHCADEEDGLISYLQLYYCALSDAKPLALIIIILWLALLFSTVGISASDFLCVDLSTLANSFGMSESLAGVTFLAFGNGSPDLFSTFAAMKSGSGSLAVGELFGAACFITAVVAGSMAIVRPFRVARRSFVRDICFFIASATFTIYAISDGKLPLWECVIMVVFYISYVVLVVAWHWHLGRKRKQQRRDMIARAHYCIPSNQELEFVGLEGQNTNDPGMGDDGEPNVHGASNEDLATLERSSLNQHRSILSPLYPSAHTLPSPSPAWKLDMQDRDLEGGGLSPSNEEEAENEAASLYLLELQKNMRLNHALVGQRQPTINSIRPSLVGALEFRSVLNSLQKARNIQEPIYLRRRENEDARGGRISYDCDRGDYSTDRLAPATRCSRAATLPEPLDGAGPYDHGNELGLPGFNFNVRPSSGTGDVYFAEEPSPRCSVQYQVADDVDMPRIDIRPPSIDLRDTDSADSEPISYPDQKQDLIDEQSIEQKTPPAGLAPPIVFTETSSPDADSPVPKKKKPQLVISTDVHRHSPQSSLHRSIRSVPWERERGGLDREQHEQLTETDAQHLAPPGASFLDPNYLTPDRESQGSHSPLSPPSPRARSSWSAKSPNTTRSPRWSLQSTRPRTPQFTRDAIRSPSPFALPQAGRPVPPLSPFPAYSDDARSPVSVIFPDYSTPIEAALPNGIVPPAESKTVKWWPRSILPAPYVIMATLFPTLYGWSDKSIWEKFLGIISAPSVLVLTLTLPVVEPRDPDADGEDVAAAEIIPHPPVDLATTPVSRAGSFTADCPTWTRIERSDSELPVPVSGSPERSPAAEIAKEWSSWLLCMQLFTGPMFIAIVVWSNINHPDGARSLIMPICITLGISVCLCSAFIFYSKKYSARDMPPYSRPLFALLGFAVAIAWISTLSQEVVTALKTLGVILSISDSLLGLTVFAFGNSIGDLIANITVARLGHPVMALAACFGSPMLNILLGIGLGGVYVNFRPTYISKDAGIGKSTPLTYHFDVSKTLLITGGAVLFNLVGLLTCVPMNKWRLDRKIGILLIGVWAATTVVNVVIELTVEK